MHAESKERMDVEEELASNVKTSFFGAVELMGV